MAITTETARQQLDIYEVTYEGGNTSILIGDEEYFGHNREEVISLLRLKFIGTSTVGATTKKPLSLSTREVCDLLRISRRTLYEWHTKGKIHASKVGRDLLFDPAEVYGLLKASVKPWHSDGAGDQLPAEPWIR